LGQYKNLSLLRSEEKGYRFENSKCAT